MYIDLWKTLEKIEDQLPEDKTPEPAQLEKAYELTLRLRSQLIAVQYDMEQFGMGIVPPVDEPVAQLPQAEKKMVVLTIPEPLPARKELTSNVEEHWIKMIHDAIAQESKTGLPYFEKTFVLIRIWTPRGTNNKRVWDTSNRAINVVINNLKGIFFDDDDFEHMACGIVADWGEIGHTEIRICALEELEKCDIFR
jgi:hypothetical protein